MVAYDAGTAQALADNEKADDCMKRVMRWNFGASATDGNRDLSDYLSIESDTSEGPTIDKEFSRNLVSPDFHVQFHKGSLAT